MGMDDQAEGRGGAWVNLKATGDKIRGKFLGESERVKTFKGDVVMKQGTNTPRVEHVIRLLTSTRDPEIEGDDGLRKVAADEGMWNAVLNALSAAKKDQPGYRADTDPNAVVGIWVADTKPMGSGVQCTFEAVWTPGDPAQYGSTGVDAAQTTQAAASAPAPGAPPDWDEEPF